MSESLTTTRPADRHRAALGALVAGLVLTVLATVYPYVDRATTGLLARHVAASYPAYGGAEVDAAVTAYLAILTTVGVLGVATWLVVAGAARAGKRWAPWAAALALAGAVCWSVAALTVTDTSGDVGLAPALGWLQALPCVAGAVTVVLLWRRR
ncbi:hypothetical protein ACFQHV_04070 [Promicromonospora thailandica]|uniref:Uncharacterized protein n=1 Tax=Promicromonospora thailandica TaxID=765201 RepID=A0A9X2G269_9MICO|nr:hypothetical protein [Promicromonospora thailandica]MCP2265705.1 hypothetical protein [Promicromonospora thailandica]BFF21715.1 hypothetical protein GCM10025730_52360 [Promicromonospora thailandica]